MPLPCWSCAALNPSALSYGTPILGNPTHPRNSRNVFVTANKFTCLLRVGVEDIADLAHNKVLIAAGASAAIGQLSKPFTSAFLDGKDLDFGTVFQAGGFPSTHTSAVVATATSLAIERGLSDSIFGLTVVYASLVMYDAQGVRREVGNHARVLNKVLRNTKVKSSTVGEARDEHGESSNSINMEKSAKAHLLLEVEKRIRRSPSGSGDEKKLGAPLINESVGHSVVEVIAGALFGFFVSLAVHATL
ncbi:uncharacterized membrane protein YuiD [Tripterygium wilfordii]|uniref:uncharacterized membrane protein YuiD n=1 Tax=Tripterygium wilfordii TaxID=458696 RepID=UPI0018F849B2|nr:uncharacterized membrane protein YuiD [Tripterygium wilfordii]